MKYAIIEAGGKQYRAEEGKTITVDLLTANVGDAVNLDKVLMVVDGDVVTVGAPFVKGASLSTTVKEHYKGKKILVFKYKPRSITAARLVIANSTPDYWFNQS